MAFHKHMNMANVSSVLGIISFIILVVTLSKEHLHQVTSAVLFPFTEKLNPGPDGSKFAHWLAISCALAIYSLFIYGIVQIFKRKHVVESTIICQDEIAAMLDALDTGKGKEINEKILEFMIKFDEEVANIFDITKKEMKSLWVFQMEKEEYVQYFPENANGTYEPNEKSYLIIVDLNNKSMPTEEEKRIIQWALRQPNPQFWDDRIERNFKGEHREFVFVRNYGEFRLGYAILFKEQKRITEKKLLQFQSASSYLMLLGKIDNLTTKMIKYLLEKVV
jgi:hypothetical protein